MKLTGLVVLSIAFVGHIYYCGGNTSTYIQKHYGRTNIPPFFSSSATRSSHVALALSMHRPLNCFPFLMQPCPILIHHHPVETECTEPLGLTCGPVKLSFTSLTPPFLYSDLYNSFWLPACHFFCFFHSALFQFSWLSFLPSPFPVVLFSCLFTFMLFQVSVFFVSPLTSLSSSQCQVLSSPFAWTFRKF